MTASVACILSPTVLIAATLHLATFAVLVFETWSHVAKAGRDVTHAPNFHHQALQDTKKKKKVSLSWV